MGTNSQRIGKYELQEQWRCGDMVEVWKAYDVQLHRHVAIKLLHANLQEDSHFIARFEREARFIASLHHPNIVQVHDFQIASQDADSTTAYMVMEYIEGPSLAHYLNSTSKLGNIPPPTIVQFFASVCLAVHYAHQNGMIHRDLKPANILLDRRNTTNNSVGEPILIDFGVAKLLGVAAGTFTNTQLGTPFYISPEQANGYAGNEHSDIYSLGVILYEMVTGKPLFQDDNPIAVMAQYLNAAPLAPGLINPNIPPALEAVLLRCLAKDPGARFPDALSLAVAVAERLNVPLPERLREPTSPADVRDMPTYLVPPSPATVTPSLKPSPAHSPEQSNRFMPPLSGTISGQVVAPASPSTPSIVRPPVSTPKTTRRQRGLILGLLALIVLLIGSSLGAFFVFFLSPAPANPLVGRAFFVSSGQINDGVQGIADQLQIDLQNIPPPPAGKSYFLWLLGDKDPTRKPSLLKGPPIRAPVLLTNDLPVKNNAVHYSYPGDAQHNGLLCVVSRLLITLEDAHRTSAIPSSNPASWKYYAEFPQTPIPTDTENHLRGLDHLRHLFYNETQVKVLALPGGLDTWVLRDTEKILEFSVSARDDFNGGTTNYELMHNQFIRILDYLDGIQNVHLDVPPGTPFLADPAIAKVSLLTVDKTKQAKPEFLTTNPPGSLDHMAQHLSEFLKAPDVSPGSRQIAQNILDGLGNAKRWLEEVRADTTELVSMTPEQLAQPSAQNLLEDLAMQVTYAYLGQLDPATNKVIAGVLQVHYAVQKLAAFDITTGVPTRL